MNAQQNLNDGGDKEQPTDNQFNGNGAAVGGNNADGVVLRDEQTIKFTFDGTSQGPAREAEETPNYGNTGNSSIMAISK